MILDKRIKLVHKHHNHKGGRNKNSYTYYGSNYNDYIKPLNKDIQKVKAHSRFFGYHKYYKE